MPARTSTIKKRCILLVHGRDFKPAAEALLDLSGAALRAGVERDYPDALATLDEVQKDLAYFGDLSNAVLESHGKTYDESLDIGDRHNALQALRAIPARKRFGIRQYDNLPGKSAVREFVADLAAPLFNTMGLSLPLISCISKDCAEYLQGKTPYAAQVRERVRDRLCAALDRDDHIMLMSHGLGCVAAYDVLWELSHEPQYQDKYGSAKIDTWVTLGAPLGDNGLRKRLLGAKEKPQSRYPTNVISWHNVAAEDDYTCHDNTLADDFKQMLGKRLVSAVKDYRIYNLAVRYGKSNPHSSIGYYIHPRVAKIVVDWLATTAAQ